MSKLAKFFLPIILIVGAVIGASSGAEARCRGGYYGGCGQWGAWGWGPWGPGVGWGAGNPYHYGPTCRWVRVGTWHNEHRVIRRTWRCW